MTQLPVEMIDILERDIQEFDNAADTSALHGDEIDIAVRNSRNAWISTDHWIAGWIWYYIQKSNRENFRYDLTDIDNGIIQYTHYGPGQFYNWHSDSDIDIFYKPDKLIASGENFGEQEKILSGEYVRKLSFTVQLSDPEDYTGGEVQFLDNGGKTFFAPKQRGTIITFDSRVKHRVRRVRSGMRKSLVGWVVGPRWK